jgi:hypothetical protein
VDLLSAQVAGPALERAHAVADSNPAAKGLNLDSDWDPADHTGRLVASQASRLSSIDKSYFLF